MGAPVKTLSFVVILVAFLGYKIHSAFKPPPLPKLEETWWGSGDPSKADTSIRPFKVNVSESVLKDLQWRLDHVRPLPPPLEGAAQNYGMNSNLLKEILEFWRTKYNWKDRESRLFNKFPQFLTQIQGLDIHYLHVKPKPAPNLKVYPLLLLHGWPGSVREFFEIIPLLTAPQNGRDFAFEVIAPSLPGFGWSQGAAKQGFSPAHIALVFKNLMQKRLGFDKFYVQGGDFGAITLQNLVTLYPEVILGFHSNMCTINTPLSYLRTFIGSFWPTLYTKAEHYHRVYPWQSKFLLRLRETGYLHMQATKPDTVGVGLTDSPAGLAAYILEKFTTGTDHAYQDRDDGGLKLHYNYADLLDNVMIYWVTGSMTTAARLYSETFNTKFLGLAISRHPMIVPTGCARFSHDFYASDGMLSETYPYLVHLSDLDGGHFAAFQVPKVLAEDIFVAVDKFRNFKRRD